MNEKNNEKKIEEKKIDENNNETKEIDDNNNKNIENNDNKFEIKNDNCEKNIDFIQELNYIKNTSKTNYTWEELKNYFIENYKSIINNFSNENNKKDEKKTNSDIDEEIIYYLTNMTKMPFTLQRMSELILEPKKYYQTAFKFNCAFKKLVNIELE